VQFACNQRQQQVSLNMFDVIKTRWGLIGVGAVAATLVIVLAAQRDDAKAPSPAGARSAPPSAAAAQPSPSDIDDSAPELPELSEPMPTCQVFRGAALQETPYFFPGNYLMLGDIDIFTEAPPLRWRRRSDDRIFELRGNLPVDLGVGAPPKYRGVLWDDNYWYSEACFEFCDRQSSVGPAMSQVRINRRTGSVARLTNGNSWVSARLLHRGFLYWGSSTGCAFGAGIQRVAIEGGPAQLLGLEDDYIRKLQGYPEGILVEAASMIGWLANGSSTIAPVMNREQDNQRDTDFGPALFDGHLFFVTVHNSTERETTVFTINATTHAVRTVLQTPGKITQIAVHGDALYFAIQDTADIFAVATRGGTPRIVVAEQPSQPCATVEGLWATDAGLVWTRGSRQARGTALYLAAWPELQRRK
jgi:hypothetical protein